LWFNFLFVGLLIRSNAISTPAWPNQLHPFPAITIFYSKSPPPSLSLPSLSVCLATVWSYRRKLVFFSILFPVYFRKFTLWHHQKLTHKRTNRHRGTGFNVPWQRRVFFLTTQTYGGQRLEQQQQLLAMIIIIIIILTIPPPLFFFSVETYTATATILSSCP
jgi:hypothetical protein